MTGMAMFQSELRSAVRDARETPPSQTSPGQAPKSLASKSLAEARPAPQAVERAGTVRLTRASPRTRPAGKRTVVRLWLPLTPLWILLAPFALLFAPALALVPATRGVPPYRTAFTVGAALIALSGTLVDVDTPDALVRIRIF